MGLELLLGHGLIFPGGSWRQVPRWRNGVGKNARAGIHEGSSEDSEREPLHLSDLFYVFMQGIYEGRHLGIWAKLVEFSNSIPETSA